MKSLFFSRALGRLSTTFPEERPANDAAHTFLVTPECCLIVELYKVIKSFADALKFQLFERERILFPSTRIFIKMTVGNYDLWDRKRPPVQETQVRFV